MQTENQIKMQSIPSLQELRSIVPRQCFEIDYKKEVFYFVRTWLFIWSGFAVYSSYRDLNLIVKPIYWFLQGMFMWGLFVLGHDFGHRSHSMLNSIFGNLCHGFLFVPYESWRITHRHHHKFTSHLDKEQIFFPIREKDSDVWSKKMIRLLGVAWILYLTVGFLPQRCNHFNPYDPKFARRRISVCISIFSVLLMASGLIVLGVTYGWWWIVDMYVIPWNVFAAMLVMTTFLHHQDDGIGWYSGNKWNYVKGNLSTIDRSYAPFNSLILSINTHQLHHLFPAMPHYNLDQATLAFRQHYPHLVRDKPNSHFGTAITDFLRLLHRYIQQPFLSDSQDEHVFS